MQKFSLIVAATLFTLSGAAHAQMTIDANSAAPVVGATVTLGDLEITATFARATLPNQPVAGGFMEITNNGETDDKLVGATSAAAGRMEVHDMAMDGDVMRMREIEGGLVLPVGETVTLKPGGYHVMFMDLVGPMVAGESVEVTLTFEQAGEVTVSMPIVMRPVGGMMHGKQEGE